MNHLVFLNAQAGELEKILSGIKTMVVRESDPTRPAAPPIYQGDSLYFLRNKDDCTVRVKATVIGVMVSTNNSDEDLSHTWKEMQPKLQFTEYQYNYWSEKKQCQLVEFAFAHKIDMILVASDKIAAGSDWIAFEEFSLIT